MALILDTGPLLAGLDAADPDHQTCRDLLLDVEEELVVPALVMAELDYWCHERLGVAAWLSFLEDLLDGAYRMEPCTEADLSRCAELQRTYREHSLGVVDASVLALVERLGEIKLATLDPRHFAMLRPRHTDSLQLLP
ncbi:MAG TPA: PIN domain-containing protein [Solirubrobacteraceae bacterium]|nr:PIN domain-containing protein [Solirubrobacteraceae bacterium]